MAGNLLASKYTKLLVGFGLVLAGISAAFVSSSGWVRLTWAIFAYALLIFIYKLAGLTLGEIGLSGKKIKTGIKYALPIVGLVIVGYFMVYIIHRSTLHDPRYKQSVSAAFYAALVLLPLKTILFEELTFRGLTPALILKIKHSQLFAMCISSAAYGAWHLVHFQNTLVGDITAPKLVVSIITFITTFLAGAIFYELRRKSDSLIVPIALHWAINAGAIIFASLSWRYL